MRKLACSLSVLALFGACSTDSTTDGTGGAGGSGGAKSNGGSHNGGAGGEVPTGQGGKVITPEGGGGGIAEGGAGPLGGSPTIPEGGAGAGGMQGGEGGIGTAGHANTGGTLSGGTGGAGTGGTTVVISPDTCTGTDAKANDERTTATPYTLGTAYTACLQTTDDVDVYSFQVPADSRGGYVSVSITDVGTKGDVKMNVFSAADNGEFHGEGTNTDGASIYLWFNAKPGARFYIPVAKYLDWKAANPYTFKATYTQVPDSFEPNDVRAQAAAIQVGANVQAYAFAGWEFSTGIPVPEWADWYKVDLAAGDVNIELSIMAADCDGNIVLYDPVGTQIANNGSNTDGSTVSLKHTIATAGTYFVKINPYLPPAILGNTVAVPYYLSTPYGLKVTQ